MYKLEIDNELNKLISPFNQFVLDVLDFLDCETKIKRDESDKDIKLLLKELENYNFKLFNVAKGSDLKKHLYYLKMSSFKDNIDLKKQYNCYSINYENILDEKYLKCFIFDQQIKDAFDYFYNTIGGLKSYIDNYIDNANFKNVLNVFREKFTQNKTCPYCDLHEIEFDLTSVDHFLPKSVYPTLSIFPPNLIVACTACNDRIKRANMKFPIFHPYFHDISKNILFSYNFHFKRIDVNYVSSSGASIEIRRAENYNDLFKILIRYNKKIEYFKQERRNIRYRVKATIQSLLNISPMRLDEIPVKEILQKEYEAYLKQQKESEGIFQMSKIKTDLAWQVINDLLDYEEEYLRNELSRKFQ